MQPVVPDPIVSRPLRPEPLARARGNDQAGAFDAMLDAKPPEAPRPERPARADRRDDVAPKGRPEARAEHASDTGLQHAAEPAKFADSAPPGQAKNGQLSNTDEPVAADTPAEGDTVQAEAAAQVAVALDAIVVEADGKAATTDETETPAVTAEPAAKDSDETSVPAADAKPAEIAPIVVAVALPVQAAPAPVIVPAADADVAPVAATLAPADPASAEASPVPVPADGKDKARKSAAPAPADADIEAMPDAPKPAPKELAAAEPKQPEQKTETDRPKSAQPSGQPASEPHASIKQAPDAHAAAPASDRPEVSQAAADPQAKPAHQPHAAEPAAPRAVSPEAPADAPALPPTAAPVAGMPANAPIMPFGLALSSSLAATLPHAALRVETDNPVPLAGVAVEIVSRAQDGLKRFDIRLDPPELGRIDVRLDVDHGGKVTSRLIVERAETLDLLRRDAPQLERALQQAGLNTEGGMQFSLRDQNVGRDQARDNAAASHLIVPEDDTAAAEAARRGYGRLIGLGGGIDIRV